MARFQVLYWQDVPSLVKAFADDGSEVSGSCPTGSSRRSTTARWPRASSAATRTSSSGAGARRGARRHGGRGARRRRGRARSRAHFNHAAARLLLGLGSTALLAVAASRATAGRSRARRRGPDRDLLRLRRDDPRRRRDRHARDRRLGDLRPASRRRAAARRWHLLSSSSASLLAALLAVRSSSTPASSKRLHDLSIRAANSSSRGGEGSPGDGRREHPQRARALGRDRGRARARRRHRGPARREPGPSVPAPVAPRAGRRSRSRSTNRSTTSARTPTCAARSSRRTRGWSARSRPCGLPRRPSEAPFEYLERALRELDTSAEGVRRLTDLFEWAKFSHHEPRPEMRDEAIDALVAVRDELRRPAEAGRRMRTERSRVLSTAPRRSRSSYARPSAGLDRSGSSAGYVLVLAAIALAALDARCSRRVASTRRSSELERRSGRKPAAPVRPLELVRIEREIMLGTSNAGNLHKRLLPLLREAAAAARRRRPRPAPDAPEQRSATRRGSCFAPTVPRRTTATARASPCGACAPIVDDAGEAVMELAELRDRASRVLDEVERAIVGKRDALELILLALLCDGHVLLEDYPGLAKTLIARSFAQATSLAVLAHPVHARPDALRRDRLVDLRPAERRVHVPAGPDLHQPAPRRRDQPRPAEDAGGAARGDAGAAGDDRGRDARARRAVHRARDAEPDRVRGHVSAAGGAARPLPRCASVSATRAASTRSRCSRGGSTAARTRSSSTRSSTRRRSSRCSVRSSRCTSPTAIEGYIVDLVTATRTLDAARGRREPARKPRAAEALAREGGALRPRLRRAGGREGDRDSCAGASADVAARALGAARAR